MAADAREAERRMYENIAFSAAGKQLEVRWTKRGDKEIGYTVPGGTVFLSYANSFTKKLPGGLRPFFRAGVFAHEVLHQVYTDFNAMDGIIAVTGGHEREVALLLANILEDTAIEYRGSSVFGGRILKALHFTIQTIYRSAPPVSEARDAFSQLCNALIQFGDMGVVKGDFTFPEARECFNTIAPEYNDAVLTYTSRERFQAALKWARMTRSLWKKEYASHEEYGDLLQKTRKSGPLPGNSGLGAPARDGLGDGDPESPVAKRRAEAAGKIHKGATDTGESTNKPAEGDGTGKETGDDSGRLYENPAGYEKSYRTGRRRQDSDSPCGGMDGATDGQDVPGFTGYSPPGKDDIKGMGEDISKVQGTLREEEQEKEDNFDIPVQSGRFRDASCYNRRMAAGSGEEQAYRKLTAKYARETRMLASSMGRLFRNDADAYIRAGKGRLNVKRAARRTTVKIFDKRLGTRQVDDLAVMLLIDESGSMAGGKIETACAAASVLAESFAHLKIPCYVMGFTTGENGADAAHHHYVTWKNTWQERCSLAGMAACNGNFDGYSIRYATGLLKRKTAAHKILFVISDGLPACAKYRTLETGLKDTAEAVKEAGHSMKVMGIGIEDCVPEKLEKIYGGNFVHCARMENLVPSLASVLKKIVRQY